jgi:hypothetical protein
MQSVHAASLTAVSGNVSTSHDGQVVDTRLLSGRVDFTQATEARMRIKAVCRQIVADRLFIGSPLAK